MVTQQAVQRYTQPSGRSTAYGSAALTSEMDRLRWGTAHGFRHHDLYVGAFRMGQLVAVGHLDYMEALQGLLAAGMALELVQRDVVRTVENGLAAGFQRPREGAVADPALLDGNDARMRVQELRDAVHASPPWRGSKGAALLKLFDALCRQMMHAGKVSIEWSVREWGEAAGMNGRSVSRLAPQLLPVVVRSRRGNRFTGRRTVWSLGRLPVDNCKREIRPRAAEPPEMASAMGHISRIGVLGLTPDPAADEFHHASSMWLILSLFEPGREFTVGDFKVSTGLHPATVRAKLHELARLGHVRRTGRFTWELVSLQGDAVALASVPAWGVARRRRHVQERIVHRRRFADPATGRCLGWSVFRPRPLVVMRP